jgi:hypothetical protein
MAELTDPTSAMVSFQQAIRDGTIALARAALDRDVFVYMDKLPGGHTRFVYARMNRQIVLPFANFVTNGFEEGFLFFRLVSPCRNPSKARGERSTSSPRGSRS